MKVGNYYNFTSANSTVTFTRKAASAFAKEIAGDFNPIHNPDARRFCVPGDLLFAVVLDRYHARAAMNFEFEQMVDDRVSLELKVQEYALRMVDSADKCYLDVAFSGDKVESDSAKETLIAAYVKFSGQTFPFLLVDLMQRNNVMINPQRPLVIYKSMSISLTDTSCSSFDLAFTESSLKADGRKGEVILNFNIISNGSVVGTGRKNMLLGGLREYQQDVIDALVEEYNTIKTGYSAQFT